MKAGISPQELAQRVSNVVSSRRDLIVAPKHLSFVHDEAADRISFQIESEGEYEPTNLFTRQLTQAIKLPATYAERLEREDKHLLAYSANRLLQRDEKRRMVRTLQNGSNVARAYLSDRYRPLDNEQVLQEVLPMLANIPGLEIVDCELTEHRMYIKAITPRIQGDVKVGQTVQAGVVLSNSEVGAGALNISPLTYNLACLNGMIIPDLRFRAFHIGRKAAEDDNVFELLSDETKLANDRATLMKARDVALGIFNEEYFESLLGRMRASTEEKLESKRPDKAVEVLAEKIGLNETEQVSVLQHLLMGGDLTRWGFANAVTAMAQEVPSYDRSVQLEQLGAKVMELPKTDWCDMERAKDK